MQAVGAGLCRDKIGLETNKTNRQNFNIAPSRLFPNTLAK